MGSLDFSGNVHTGNGAQVEAPGAAALSVRTMEPLAVSITEACRISGLSRSELYRRMAAGQIEARKSGVRTLVLVASLKAHLASLPAAAFRAPSRSAA